MIATDVRIRELEHHREMAALEELFREIWAFTDAQVIPRIHFVGAALAGHQILGAYEGTRLVGGSWGFLCYDGNDLTLHSHITGVLPEHRGTGLGYELKMAQRSWCLARGIRLVTWTFDPLVARNAAFNLRKLRVIGVRFLPDFYGPMADHFNIGEPTDRLEVEWRLDETQREPAEPRSAALVDDGGRPAPGKPGDAPVALAVPRDYHELRARDPETARAWRAAAGDALDRVFALGLVATGFDRACRYIFTAG